eukprot:TRINITY_DN9502_c0_g1_i3.p1 TRINITY_DN9502_c0_g1~~TRINITY_DN9502_c0_g1_i3.p1  ORF type:complete len:182 (+),score=34.85 TRINITY_DN9502_c0_g1_i3:64-609(+)
MCIRDSINAEYMGIKSKRAKTLGQMRRSEDEEVLRELDRRLRESRENPEARATILGRMVDLPRRMESRREREDQRPLESYFSVQLDDYLGRQDSRPPLATARIKLRSFKDMEREAEQRLIPVRRPSPIEPPKPSSLSPKRTSKTRKALSSISNKSKKSNCQCKCGRRSPEKVKPTAKEATR